MNRDFDTSTQNPHPQGNLQSSKSWAPQTKVASGGLAAAIGLILIGLIEYTQHVDIPSPYEAAVYTITFFLVQYLIPNQGGV